uniref:Importin-5-like isoform X4 n=1 Tax=Nicotiana tabacum TaxID=4097 RepID=A0A1S3XVT4_TOBAC|nr:PREDICTED: importin-5-like isoform X4 [Nicotiana tabacum]
MDRELAQFQMEAILGPELEPFETFILDHMSRAKKKYSKAKSMFSLLKQKDPNSLALKLTDSLGSSHEVDFREVCAELLHKLLDDDDLCTWHNLSVSTQSAIKRFLIDHIEQEESESEFIIQELRHTILYLAVSLVPDNNWSELMPFLMCCITSGSNKLKVSAFLIYGLIADRITVVCSKNMQSQLLNALNYNTSLDLDVRIAAMTTVICFIQSVSSSNEKERFQDLLPGMMKTMTDALTHGKEKVAAARDVLNLFIELAQNEPNFFRTQLTVVVGSILEIAEDEKLEEVTRHLAVEFLITLVEARERAPGMMRKLPSFSRKCFAILLKLLLDIKDDPAWHSAETEHEHTGETNNYTFGMTCLNRFSVALGGKTVVPIAIEQLSAYVVSPEWEKRHAALVALAQIAEGSSKANAARAVAAFSGSLKQETLVPPETLVPHLDGLLSKLVVLIQNDKVQMVQEAALKALSGIANLSKVHFQKYYDFVKPYLKIILVNENGESYRYLRSIALECISFIGTSVGKEKFKDDLKQVMEVLNYSLQEPQVKEFDIACNLQSCFRICYCMGKDFLPYMSTLMPPLVECAQLEPDKTVSSDNLYDSVHKVKFRNEIIRLGGNDLLYQKSLACDILGLFARKLEEDFYPWIPQVASVLVPLLKFYTHDEARKCSVKSMYNLLRSAKLAVEKEIAQGGTESYFKELADYIILSLLEALHEESMAEICAFMLDELNHCLQISPPLLIEDQLSRIVNEVKHVITESSNRKQKLKERAKSKDFDAEEDELLRGEKEQEDNSLFHVGLVLNTLIETFKSGFLPFFDELMSSYLIPMWRKDMTAQERCTPFLIFDHLLEECPEAALKYSDEFLPLLLDASNDESPAVRQCAFYGLVLYAEYGGSDFKPVVKEAISRINVVIMHFWARESENESAFDNAVYALGKIFQFHWENIDSSTQIIPVWLNCLPIKCDMAAAKYVHDLLCSMVERLDEELIGPNYQYIPKIISIFAEVLCSEIDFATQETTNRMINALRHIQQTLSPAAMESAFSYLLPRQEMELKSILSLEEDV